MRDGKGVWWEVLLLPPTLTARVGHIAVCEHGLGFILHSPCQEVSVFTIDLKVPTPDMGQRSYRWVNDEVVVSTFPYLPLLPCAQQESQCQDVNPVVGLNPHVPQGGGGWFYNILTGNLWNMSYGIPGVGTGLHMLLLNRVNVTESGVPDSGMEIHVSEHYGKTQKTWKVWE